MDTEPKNRKKSSVSYSYEVKNAKTVSDIFNKLSLSTTREPDTKEPNLSLDKEVADIFKQAYDHRDKLVKFFVRYTWVFSGFVALIIFLQACVRAFIPNKEVVEVVPYWALNLLVVGLVGQFIALLTIVTKKVWLFEEFFKQAGSYHQPKQNNNEDNSGKTESKK